MACVTTKGELKELHSCKIDLSKHISISSEGGLILFDSSVVKNQQNFFDYKGRVVKIAFGYRGEIYFEFSYFGDYITNALYKYDTLEPEYFSFSYKDGKLDIVSGPNGQFKVIYTGYGDVERGERI